MNGNIDPDTDRSRLVWQIALLEFISGCLLAAVTLYLLFVERTWHYGVLAGNSMGFVAATVGSFWLCRRNKPVQAITLLLIAMYGCFAVSIVITDDPMLLFRGRSLILIALIIAVLTLPSRRLGTAAAGCLTGGLLVGALDTMRPEFGFLPAPLLRKAFIGVTAAQALVFGGMLIAHFRRQPIMTKLVVAFLAVALAPVAVLGYGNAMSMQNVLRDTANDRLKGAAQQTALELDRHLNALIEHNESIAGLPVLVRDVQANRDGPDQQNQYQLQDALQSLFENASNNILDYALLSRDGHVIAATSPSRASNGKTAEVRGGEGAKAESIIRLERDGEDAPYLSIYSPVFNDAGAPVATLRLRAQTNALQDIAGAVTGLAGAQSHAVVVDEHGVCLADGNHPEHRFEVATELSGMQDAGTHEANRSDQGQVYVDPASVSLLEPALEQTPDSAMMTSMAAMETMPWRVYFIQPQAVLAGPLRQEAYTVLMTTLIAGLLVTILAVSLAHQLAGPLMRLTAAAERVQGGDLSVHVPVESPDETGRLASAFNAMTGRLRGVVQGLEQRVVQLKETEAALRKSEQHLRLIFEYAPVGMCLVDSDGQLIDANRSLCESFGYNRDELLAKRLADLTHREDLDRVNNEALRLESGEVDGFECEVRYIRKDGETLHAVARVSLMREDDGSPQHFVVQVLDVTERRHSQQEIAARERELRAVIDDAPIGMSIIEPQGVITHVNRAMCEVTGYSRDELLGKTTRFLTHPDDVKETLRQSQRLLDGKDERFLIEKRYIRKDGVVITVLLGLALIRDMNGEPLHFVAQIVDLSELRATQAALEASEREIRAVIEHAPVGMAILTPELKYLHVNHALTELLGYARNEFFEGGRVTASLGEEWKEVETAIGQLIRGECSQYRGEHRILRKDGEYRDCLIHLSLVRDADDAPLHIVGQAMDITERNLAEARLAESEARYRLISENSTDIITVHGPDTRLLYVSPVVKQLLGYQPAELIGKPSSELVHRDDWPAAGYAPDGQFEMRATPTVEGTFRLRHRDGRYIWFEARSKGVIDPQNGRLLELVSVSRDITDRLQLDERRRDLEAQVQHAQKLESLGVLAGGIAHDFNNLLVGMLGHSGLALMDLPESHPSTEHVRNIEVAAQRASELTKQLLAYSGKGQFVIEPVDLNHMVREMSHLLEVSASKKAILAFELAGDLPIIEGDASQLRQIVMNLITNASDAIGDDEGTINVRTVRQQLGTDDLADMTLAADAKPGDYVCLTVSDTGCGMDEEMIERIFDPFFTTKLAGRGLGLAAILGIVRGHGGCARVQSQVGQGTEFSIYIPASDRPLSPSMVTTPVTVSEAGIGTNNKTILVIDDEAMVRTLARNTLERYGYKVITACDGREGVAKFREHGASVHGVLLDMTMPHMDGEQTFNALCEMNPDVRVVLSSGYDQQDTVRRFPDRAPAAFIQKPYKPAALISLLRSVLGE